MGCDSVGRERRNTLGQNSSSPPEAPLFCFFDPICLIHSKLQKLEAVYHVKIYSMGYPHREVFKDLFKGIFLIHAEYVCLVSMINVHMVGSTIRQDYIEGERIPIHFMRILSD